MTAECIAHLQIGDLEHVNERRRAVGLNTVEERTNEINADQQPEQVDPVKLAEYRRKAPRVAA